jgi:lysophospholipase L1-like esterase
LGSGRLKNNKPRMGVNSPVKSLWRTLAACALFALVIGVFCEIGARLDDWFFDEISVTANPRFENLFVRGDDGVRRGVPGARWKKVALNNLGMRGPDVPPERRPGCRRWLFLGASETFGEPSRVADDYPARVRALAQRRGCVEVLNSAFPGIAPHSLLAYYESVLAQYRPDVVFVYASTHFYLAELPDTKLAATTPRDTPPAATEPPGLSLEALLGYSRFFDRLRDSAEMPAAIQKRRLRQWIKEQSVGKPAGWAFGVVPEPRLEIMARDLTGLIDGIRRSGAEPVLMTHAVRVANPPRAEDMNDLFAMRVYVPRASEQVIAAFEYAAADRVRALAAEKSVRLIDVAKLMNGRREQFIDLVHFSSAGHSELARHVDAEMTR